ncbi:translation initiation factor eIF-2B subunit delta [Kwoniella heveanensis CBS 569]|uniref:Translation initiation factor eIF2B subunit delta n=1 Tax=Kwoniella heveanensis BCC8398 TaxID=1296120 RepID=A0A1B9GXL5_9TREE|nr:translation initiation factor eIF-2B subunit delta [Kwoniella heveanensis BCC8398]OCF38391.1 translation initiation factor eIF-2B subunit delta [Kwoniella heveanensis CBS 569]
MSSPTAPTTGGTASLNSSTSTVRPPKEPKAPKAPQPHSQSQSQAQGPAQGGDAAKGKSAKELKKEKRAAAVAARAVGGADSPVPGDGRPSLSTNNSVDGRQGAGLAAGAGGIGGQHAGGGGAAGPSAPRRPPHYSEPSATSLSTIQQNLFFSHLPHQASPDTAAALTTGKLHPIIIRLGVLMSSGQLRGANARTMGMMAAFREVIRDYESPDQAVLWKDLPVYLSPMIAWLEGCRPKGVGGGNAIRWLKSEINRLGEEGDRSETEQKEYLVEAIGLYLRDRIEFAGKVIADNAKEKIRPGDTVVTYARSSVVERVLLEAWRDMKAENPEASFKVVVVDSRPLLEGRHLLDALSSAGLQCSYILLPLLSSVLPQADLVLLGGSALHSDGALYSRSGTALVAMLAKEHRVPVVACVETYKFGEKVVLDGVATNELGRIDELLKNPLSSGDKLDLTAAGANEKMRQNLTPLHLVYDVTPPSLITAVCTEIGFIPPSSVPTVLGKTSGII